MSTQLKSALSLKVRSKSMPLVNILPKSPKIPKMRVLKHKNQEQLHQDHSPYKQILDLQNIKNKETQQINTKIKVLAERSLKKLEERYDTIDKWKQKYVPESALVLIRNKLSLESHSPKINDQDKKQQIVQEQQLLHQLFPIIIKRQIAPTPIPDQKEQGKRLEMLLKERLEKNKKYYQLKSTIIEKQINYFQEMNTFIPLQKKRQIQLKKLLLKSQKDRAYNRGLFFQKLSLSEPKIKKEIKPTRVRAIERLQRQQSKIIDYREHSPIKNYSSIHDLKAQLMEEIIGTTPEGWDTVNHLDSPEEEELA